MASPEHNSEIPEDPIAEIIEDLRFRDEQRKRAIELGWIDLENAQTTEDKISAIDSIARMLHAREEYRNLYPEVFEAEED